MSVVTLPELKAHLSIKGESSDSELTTFIARIEAALAIRIGPLTPTSKTERVRGWRDTLYLKCTPVISITSVTAIEGNTIDVNMLTPTEGGRVEFKQYGYFASRFYDVVYQAGRTANDDLKLDILEVVKRFWDASKRGGGLGGGGEAYPVLSRIVEEPLFGQLIDQLTKPYQPVLGR